MCFGTNSIRGIVNYSNSRENLPNSTIREYYSNSAIRGEHCWNTMIVGTLSLLNLRLLKMNIDYNWKRVREILTDLRYPLCTCDIEQPHSFYALQQGAQVLGQIPALEITNYAISIYRSVRVLDLINKVKSIMRNL
jgi:hypothetical protein